MTSSAVVFDSCADARGLQDASGPRPRGGRRWGGRGLVPGSSGTVYVDSAPSVVVLSPWDDSPYADAEGFLGDAWDAISAPVAALAAPVVNLAGKAASTALGAASNLAGKIPIVGGALGSALNVARSLPGAATSLGSGLLGRIGGVLPGPLGGIARAAGGVVGSAGNMAQQIASGRMPTPQQMMGLAGQALPLGMAAAPFALLGPAGGALSGLVPGALGALGGLAGSGGGLGALGMGSGLAGMVPGALGQLGGMVPGGLAGLSGMIPGGLGGPGGGFGQLGQPLGQLGGVGALAQLQQMEQAQQAQIDQQIAKRTAALQLRARQLAAQEGPGDAMTPPAPLDSTGQQAAGLGGPGVDPDPLAANSMRRRSSGFEVLPSDVLRVARAVLATPSLRGVPCDALGAKLGVAPRACRGGLASLAVALREGDASRLRPQWALADTLGASTTFDQLAAKVGGSAPASPLGRRPRGIKWVKIAPVALARLLAKVPAAAKHPKAHLARAGLGHPAGIRARGEAGSLTPDGLAYIAEKGDFGSTIAQKLTGDALRWKELRDANPGSESAQYGMVFTTGQRLALPPSWVKSAPVGSPPQGSPPQGSPPQFAPPQSIGARTYRLKSGDLPVDVSQRFAGRTREPDANKSWTWKQLGAVNPGMNVLGAVPVPWYSGQLITLPASWTLGNTGSPPVVAQPPQQTPPKGPPPPPPPPPPPKKTPPDLNPPQSLPPKQPGTVDTIPPGGILQVQVMLSAWSMSTGAATPKDFGTAVTDLSGAFDARSRSALGSFQAWSNKTAGTALRTDAVLDAATYDALVSWAMKQAAYGPPGGNPVGKLPPGWKPGDPIPGVIPGWKPGDPIPVPAGWTPPTGWKPGDVLPKGWPAPPPWDAPPGFPPGWKPGDPLPPYYDRPAEEKSDTASAFPIFAGALALLSFLS